MMGCGKTTVGGLLAQRLDRPLVDTDTLIEERQGRSIPDIFAREGEAYFRALELELCRELPGRVVIMDVDYPDINEVDNKLLRLAQDLKGSVLTNDFNLAKVAQVQGVHILNVNALKAVWLPGEVISIEIVHQGKEPNQGLAYLPDGTMIVVENGRQHIGRKIKAEVSSVLQTATGRMIFARPK